MLIHVALFVIQFFFSNLTQAVEKDPCSTTQFIKEIDTQYDPSSWVVNLPYDEAVPNHVNVVSNASQIARQRAPNLLDVRYGPREHQLIDLYSIDLPSESPIFVYLHGGFWQLLSKDISAYPVIPLRQAGIRTVIGGYDLAPNVSLDVIIEEIKELALFILEMARRENCRDVWFCGHSAGAQLFAMLLATDWFYSLDPKLQWPLRGMVLISGIYDVSPIVNTHWNFALNLSLEGAVKDSPMFEYGKVEPLGKITVLLAVAEHDSPAIQGQTYSYNEVLKVKMVERRIVKIQDKDHYTIVSNLQCPSYELTKIIISLIKQS